MPSMTRKVQSTRTQRRAEIQRQLLEGTERLMAQGWAFTELSVDRLATGAGISRATFYVYFEDKSQLLLALTRQVFVELNDAAALWWNDAERRDPADVRAAMKEIIATFRRHQAVLTAVVEMAAYDRTIAEVYQVLLNDVAANAQRVMERGVAEGAVAPLPIREAATALTWMVERTCHQVVRFSPPEDDDRLAEAMTEIVWRTYYLTTAVGEQSDRPDDPGTHSRHPMG
jgi:TetR/AcrR family transcriptional regulator, ethionamide resistance regulator